MSLSDRARDAAKRQAYEHEREQAAREARKVPAFEAAAQRRRQEFMKALNAWASELGVTARMVNMSATMWMRYENMENEHIDAHIKATFEAEGVRFFAALDSPGIRVRLDRMGVRRAAGTHQEREAAWGEIKTLSDLGNALEARKSIIGRVRSARSDSWEDLFKHLRTRRQGRDRNPEGFWH